MKREARNFSDITYDEALRRARELVPFLREQAPKNEALRRLTPEVMSALHETGLLRCLQPKVWGGMELPFVAYFDIPEMLARGDISVGWVAANLASHHRNLVWWDRQAQEEVWGADADAGIASGIAYPQGRGVYTEGGVTLSGEWNFSSGTDHSAWSMLACMVRDGDKVVDYAYCLVPSSDYETIDDWHTLGMRASSSKTVRCKDVFVPAHRVLSMHVTKPGHAWPGLAMHHNPHYRIPTSALGGDCIGACLVGNARAAIESTIELVKSRSTSYTGAKMRDFPTVQLRMSSAGEDRCSGAPHAQRLPGSAAAVRKWRDARRRNTAALQAQLRACGEDVRGSGRQSARDGGRERHLRPLSVAAHVSRSARGGGALQLQHRRAASAVGTRGARWCFQQPDALSVIT